ncbi:TolC family protein, partial [Marinitenerispora sediminis]|uniref:hypothetical protein n=1 Tax=Marinitenerispora sediminis TaxID=1931232 RepID=UPI000DF8BAAC
MTDGNGQPVHITAQMELEAPAQPDEAARERHPESGVNAPARDTSTQLAPDAVRRMIDGGRPDAPTRTPLAAALAQIPTYTSNISAATGDRTQRQRVYELLAGVAGLQRYLKRAAGHDFFPTFTSGETLAGNSDQLFSTSPGHRTRNWLRGWFHSGRHTVALFADRTDVRFHDLLPSSTLKWTTQQETSISRSEGTSKSVTFEGDMRGVGNPNQSADAVRAGQAPNAPGRGLLRANDSSSPSIQAAWNLFSLSRGTSDGTSESATFTEKTSFKPHGGVRTFNSDVRQTEVAEIRHDFDFMANVPRHARDKHLRGFQHTIGNEEFGYAPLADLYEAGLVNDRYHSPETAGDGAETTGEGAEAGGRTGQQPNPNLRPERFMVRPGFEDRGQRLTSVPRTPPSEASGDPVGVQLAERLKQDNYALTGESREAVLAEINAHATGRRAPKSVPVKLYAESYRASRGPAGDDRRERPRVEADNQTRGGTIQVETVRGRPTVTRPGGKGAFGHEVSLAAKTKVKDADSDGLGTRVELAPVVPVPLPGGDQPRDLPAGLPADRFNTITPAPRFGTSGSRSESTSTAEKETTTWATDLDGPYAVAETPEHIRLTVSYGSRKFTIEGDYATVKESFHSAYLTAAAATSGTDTTETPDGGGENGGTSTTVRQSPDPAAEGRSATTPRPAPAPRPETAPTRLDGAIRDWTPQGRGTDQAAQPEIAFVPLSVEADGRGITDAGYVALARAHGWSHSGDLGPADVQRAKEYAIKKAGIRPDNDPVSGNVNRDSTRAYFNDAAEPDGVDLLDIGHIRWKLGAKPRYAEATIIDVAVDSQTKDSHSSTTTRSTAVATAGHSGGGLPVRPGGIFTENDSAAQSGTTAGTPSDGVRGDTVLLSGQLGQDIGSGDRSTRTDDEGSGPPTTNRDPVGSKRSYLVSIPTDWVVAAQRTPRHLLGLGRAATFGMASVRSTVTGWISEAEARALGLLPRDPEDAKEWTRAWEAVAKAQKDLADAEKSYFTERGKLPLLVERLAAADRAVADARDALDEADRFADTAVRTGDGTARDAEAVARARDVLRGAEADARATRKEYTDAETAYTKAREDFENKFDTWWSELEKARRHIGDPGVRTGGTEDATAEAASGAPAPRTVRLPEFGASGRTGTTNTADTADTAPAPDTATTTGARQNNDVIVMRVEAGPGTPRAESGPADRRVDEARVRVARAQADVVRFETDLADTRTNLALADDDPYHLGGLVEAAQRRVAAAQAEVDLARARLDAARGSRSGTETARGEVDRAQTELDRARTDLDQARDRFTQAGGTYLPDGTP